MKLLSFQPCSLYQNGGCGRVLRRLYEGREQDVISIAYYDYYYETIKGDIPEVKLTLFPLRRKWMRWKLRNLNSFFQRNLFASYNKKQILKTALSLDVDVLHIVDQGILLSCLCEPWSRKDKQLWISFHDHYTQVSSYENTKVLWENADRRFVISRELGDYYQAIFSNKPFEIITDGVKPEEISIPKRIESDIITLYFGGLLHYHYQELFKSLITALNNYPDNLKFKLIIRGTEPLKSLNAGKILIEYRNDFVSDEEIKNEIDAADILYLPIKFTSPEFYKYSLSTKMIGYLSAPGTILYHGPEDSALCKLLCEHKAAVCCTSLQIDNIEKCLLKIFEGDLSYSKNSKELINKKFLLEQQHKKFWI